MNHISDRDEQTIQYLSEKTAIDANEVSKLIDIIADLEDKLDSKKAEIDNLKEEVSSLKDQLSSKK